MYLCYGNIIQSSNYYCMFKAPLSLTQNLDFLLSIKCQYTIILVSQDESSLLTANTACMSFNSDQPDHSMKTKQLHYLF